MNNTRGSVVLSVLALAAVATLAVVAGLGSRNLPMPQTGSETETAAVATWAYISGTEQSVELTLEAQARTDTPVAITVFPTFGAYPGPTLTAVGWTPQANMTAESRSDQEDVDALIQGLNDLDQGTFQLVSYTRVDNGWSDAEMGSLGLSRSRVTWGTAYDLAAVIGGPFDSGDYALWVTDPSYGGVYMRMYSDSLNDLTSRLPSRTATPSTTPSSTPTRTPTPTTPTATTVATATPTPATFSASADAYTLSTNPTQNYGTSDVLNVRGSSSPYYRSYLQLDVSGLSGTVMSAILRLWVADTSVDYGQFGSVSSSWTETGLTWNNQPSMPMNFLAVSGPENGYVTIDVTSEITGNGTYSFGIQGISTDLTAFGSRDDSNADHRPLLTIVTQ